MWTWLFLLLLLEACTGEEGEKMLVLCVGCGHAVAVCGCTCVCVWGGNWGIWSMRLHRGGFHGLALPRVGGSITLRQQVGVCQVMP